MAMSDKDHALQLLEMATRDHNALINMQDPEGFSDEIFGFHAQQAIEKALKAWIAVGGLTYPKSHDVSILIRILETAGSDLSEFPNLEDYTPFAVQYRYEMMMGDEKLARNEAALEIRQFLDHVRRIVENHP